MAMLARDSRRTNTHRVGLIVEARAVVEAVGLRRVAPHRVADAVDAHRVAEIAVALESWMIQNV